MVSGGNNWPGGGHEINLFLNILRYFGGGFELLTGACRKHGCVDQDLCVLKCFQNITKITYVKDILGKVLLNFLLQ